MTVRDLVSANQSDIEVEMHTIRDVVFVDEFTFDSTFTRSRLRDVLAIVLARPEVEVMIAVEAFQISGGDLVGVEIQVVKHSAVHRDHDRSANSGTVSIPVPGSTL